MHHSKLSHSLQFHLILASLANNIYNIVALFRWLCDKQPAKSNAQVTSKILGVQDCGFVDGLLSMQNKCGRCLFELSDKKYYQPYQNLPNDYTYFFVILNYLVANTRCASGFLDFSCQCHQIVTKSPQLKFEAN